MDLVKSPLVLILSFGLFGLLPVFGQTPPPKSPPVFSLLNLVRSPQPIVLKIGPEPVGYDPISFGACTGNVTWLPNIPLLVEAPGFSPVKIPPSATGSGECPLFIVQDALEKVPGGADPKPVLKYTVVPNAEDRPQSFADGLNLTSQKSLVGTMEGKTVSLEQGKRTRLTTKNGFVLEIKSGPKLAIGGSEDGGGMLVVFYENLEGKIEFALINDTLISP